ncbi:chloride channel protein, partial [Klebsiella pneumoniae]|uniref:chloride channel protein n=1 Tax=Klebsiella pneumoniae TaxID=573 RepID=UPI002FDC4BD2
MADWNNRWGVRRGGGKLWVACGAAAGMASAYHAPLAGSLFIAEILFGTLMLASLGPG